jgi:general secretion pathway protein C
LPAQWLSNSSDITGRASAIIADALQALARPAGLRRLRRVLLALFALWCVLALSRVIWALLPLPESVVGSDVQVINPVQQAARADSAEAVDIQRMVSWHLFGEAGAATPASEVVIPDELAAESSRAGIEKGARETRLDLILRGVVASSEDGLGHAIIEHKKRQDVYAVEDKLPVSGEVVLAKVMPQQVVLDNGGTYELLPLFEDSALDAQLPAQGEGAPVAPRARPESARQLEQRNDSATTELARSFRERLYQDPQSLAEVVSVSAVRADGALLGYQVAPGKQREQFEQLGFKQGDLVTGINGIALNDPANTMRLYQTLRTASEAVIDLERDGQALSISVNLDSGAAQ